MTNDYKLKKILRMVVLGMGLMVITAGIYQIIHPNSSSPFLFLLPFQMAALAVYWSVQRKPERFGGDQS
ncbi:hypothetical protein [Halobacillus litoralis]|uniref:hypothetical protein n=1 Tax=Halobacillus litoralis TaxID=45668 RepID=UPI001CD7003F|nr:hypothetical protein [Halobacillus litoralis]MCA1023642.1 hypothetical protein [Halobacillus litoralis]